MSDLKIRVRLTPKAAKNVIQGWHEDSEGNRILKISVTTVPEKGKANKALIRLLSREWKIPQKNIILAKGTASKNKLLILKGISEIPS